ncbi:MAG: hypothetical protein KAR20_02415, partial [Candidatus Heimdallarchaeota archaeon]|nr:hypothetical protein [Candidatus Heimdallarchaeota archaeon]
MNAIDFLENERKKKINSRSNADAGEHSKTVGKHPNKPAKKEASEGYPRNQGTITLDEVLYREFKKQESILQTYAVIMQQFQSLSERFQYESELGILQDRLFNT